MNLSDKINRVTKWLLWQHQTEVTFSSSSRATDLYKEEENLIIIHSRCSKELQLHSLLHEIGHLLIRKNDQLFNRNTWKYKNHIDVLREEVLAWEHGLSLSFNLDLNINIKRYDYHMRLGLNSYWKYYKTKLNIY